MGMYLMKASYSAEGIKGVLKDGGNVRRAVVEEAIAGLGGKLESFYFAFGDADVYLLADFPDAASAAAFAMSTAATGAVSIATTVLVTPEEIDNASKMNVDYRPPGKAKAAARRAR